MSALPSGGKLLSAEQSLRLTILDQLSRDHQVELIAAHIRRAAGVRNLRDEDHGMSVREWYQLPMRAKSL